MSPPTSPAPVSLADVRVIRSLQRGEPAALQGVWDAWKHACWSICKAMAADLTQAKALLLVIYGELPASSRTWDPQRPVCCQLGSLVHRAIAGELDLPGLTEVDFELPEAVAPASTADLLGRMGRVPPLLRLVYLVDLFFHCPSAETSALLGIPESALRQARSRVAWALITPQEA